MKKIILISVFILTSPAAFSAKFDGSIPEWQEKKERFSKSEESFKKVFKTLKESYADKTVSEDDLYRAATEGMLAALNKGDEDWNRLLSPRDAEDMNIDISGQLVGIGSTLEFDTGTQNAKVKSILAKSAAEKAGLKANDLILSVNGKRYKELRDMVMEIRGKAGETVHLKVLRGDKLLDFKIVRDVVKIPFSVAGVYEGKTGYISIQHFGKNTQGDIQNLLKLFENNKPERLIIDLRSTPGGVFEQAVEVAKLFMSEGQTIVKTKSRKGEEKVYKATGKPWSPETKLIVLTNQETASGAEILAEALRENRKALLIGTKTEGKHTVEMIEKLPNDYVMKYSVLNLITPSGKPFTSEGLKPDYEVAEYKGDFFPQDFVKNFEEQLKKDTALKFAIELPLK